MRLVSVRFVALVAVACALAGAAVAGAVGLSGSSGATTGAAKPTGVWAEGDAFWTWTGAVWLHVQVKYNASTGYVRSSPGYYIDCPSACTRPYDIGAKVTLVARPTGGASFIRWEGTACAAEKTDRCTFTITADTIVTAEFTQWIEF